MPDFRRLLTGSKVTPEDYPTAQGATISDPQQAFYGSGFENMLMPRDDSDEEALISHQLLSAALAANRVPLAGLGFDPRKMQFYGDLAGTTNTLGQYTRKDDYNPARVDTIDIHSNPSDPYDISSPTHESMHRGNEILRRAGLPHIPDYNEERGVRTMMTAAYGDPERFYRPGAITNTLNEYINPNAGSPEQTTVLHEIKRALSDQLQLANINAARLIAQRHPGGPR